MLQSDFEERQVSLDERTLPVTFGPSFYQVQERIKKWANRFSHADDTTIFSDLLTLFLISSNKFLDHRTNSHLFRLALSIHFMQKKLYRAATFFPQQRSLEIRWLPTTLEYSFSSKPVLGCLVGFNVMDRYELFDEENVLLVLQKYLPGLHLVKESSYCHASQHKNLKVFYFEIEKKDGKPFSLEEQKFLKHNLQDKVKNTIQTLAPAIFMTHNQEEVYKNILVLSQEIHSTQDLPQVHIALDYQTGKKIVFLVTLVYLSPDQEFALDFPEGMFVSERIVTVKKLRNRPVEAHIFRIQLNRDIHFLRSDGSLNFYSARQKVAALLKGAIGKFRDYNGGIIIKQQELLHVFKDRFPDAVKKDAELVESFFYGITPLEKQAVLEPEILVQFFQYFLENLGQRLPPDTSYAMKTYQNDRHLFLMVHWKHLSVKESILLAVRKQAFKTAEIAYNLLETEEGSFFNCLLSTDASKTEAFLAALKQVLEESHHKTQKKQILRIGMDYSTMSLDPRICGDIPSVDIIRLLFAGLTRFNEKGEVENGIAESIEISPDLKHYTFKLRSSFWNDGTPLTAYDFEYAWKKVLSASFLAEYAHLFYPIKNAQKAKEGKVSADQIGIKVEDPMTLKVELRHPTPYFLQLTAYPLYSPVNQLMDKQHPEWPYQSEKNYPCNGPFQLKINRPNQGFKLVKNPYYWDVSRIKLDEVVLTYMNPAKAIQAFNEKQIDWVGNPFGVWDPSYIPDKDSRVISLPNRRVYWCAFNTAGFPFHHHKLRVAFAYAVQRAQLIANAFMPLNPAYGPLLPSDREMNYPLFPEHDRDRARQLFAESLEELSISKSDFNLELLCGETGIQKYTALELQKQFQDCFEITCHLKPMLWREHLKRMITGSFQMSLVNWSSYIDDPIYTLDYFKSAKQGVNFSKWEHPQFQHLIDLSEKEIDFNQRHTYLLRAEQILSCDMPIIPLFYLPTQALVKKELQMNQSSVFSFNVARSFYTHNQGGSYDSNF